MPKHLKLYKNFDGYYKDKEHLYPNVNYFTDNQSVIYNVVISKITIDQSTINTAITGDINGRAIQEIRQKSHIYLGKYTGDNEMTLCQLFDNNSNYYYNGITPANLTGEDGDVFMKLPTFYYKVIETSIDVFDIYFAYGFKPDENYKTWNGNQLFGIYESYVTNEKVFSISGKVPTEGISQTLYKQYARNRGNGYTLIKYNQHSIIAFLFFAMYGTPNCQTIINTNDGSSFKTTGLLNTFGMNDSMKDGKGIKVWGLENWWGDCYEYVDNILVSRYIATIYNDNGTIQRSCELPESGYVIRLIIGEYLDAFPHQSKNWDYHGESYNDYHYIEDGTDYSFIRSQSGNGDGIGLVSSNFNVNVNNVGSSIVSRLAFTGNIKIENNISKFKDIKIDNN